MNGRPSPTLDRLVGLLAEAAGLGADPRIDGLTPFADLALDSVVVLEFMLAAERVFGVELDAQEMLQCGAFLTLGGLAEYVDRKAGH